MRATLPLIGLLLVACVDDEASDFDHACARFFSETSFTVVDASAVAGQGAPRLTSNTPTEIRFTGSGTELGGTVTFEATATSDYVMVFGAAVPFTAAGPDGQALEIEESAQGICGASEVGYELDLPVGVVELTFGPTSDPSLRLVIERSGDHG